VNDVLRGVITSGTGTRANIGRPAAGKTGTTENFTNAWFVGFTPTLSTAVWMGKSNSQDPAKSSLRNIKGVSRVFGGTIPAATWHDFMAAALRDVPATDFSEPAPIRQLTDVLKKGAADDFSAGPRRSAQDTEGGGPYVVEPPPPVIDPPTTTTTEPDSPDTTTTTAPPDDD
jgi:membrane peptidoglycan carboxypeptidase